MDFLENQHNWETGERSFWEFIVLFWIILSIILISVIFVFKIYILPKFQNFKTKQPQTISKVQTKAKVNIPKDNKYQSTTFQKSITPSNNKSIITTEIDKNVSYKEIKEDHRQVKEYSRINKKELKAEKKKLKQEEKLKRKLEKQNKKKNFNKNQTDENNATTDFVENPSNNEAVEMKGGSDG